MTSAAPNRENMPSTKTSATVCFLVWNGECFRTFSEVAHGSENIAVALVGMELMELSTGLIWGTLIGSAEVTVLYIPPQPDPIKPFSEPTKGFGNSKVPHL